MSELVSRQYCIENPGTIIRFFGLGVFFKMLLGGKKSLLERAVEVYERRGVKMPGPLGDSYKLAARIEFRMARLYNAFSRHFRNNKVVSSFFDDLRKEEEEHGRLMMLCLYCVKLNPQTNFSPSVRDSDVRDILKSIRDCEKKIDSLPLDEALRLTEEFERSEVNTIFGKLLRQAGEGEAGLFAQQLKDVEDHSISVPRRIRELKEGLQL